MATAQGSLRDTRHRRLGLVAVCAVTALAAVGVSGCVAHQTTGDVPGAQVWGARHV